ncbi:hypothetical protein RvY_12031 [Ramazzottius varieornatus]|uniref:Uncharacterized protein n=1 Tax=Ramazzottius varieornatus TaxID=947166 RepID=A0A1D1VQS5_RAMVA|nr:hypothetical protein RvY_12031 [Ramazzottius varieornatus]
MTICVLFYHTCLGSLILPIVKSRDEYLKPMEKMQEAHVNDPNVTRVLLNIANLYATTMFLAEHNFKRSSEKIWYRLRRLQ